MFGFWQSKTGLYDLIWVSHLAFFCTIHADFMFLVYDALNK